MINRVKHAHGFNRNFPYLWFCAQLGFKLRLFHDETNKQKQLLGSERASKQFIKKTEEIRKSRKREVTGDETRRTENAEERGTPFFQFTSSFLGFIYFFVS